LLVLGNGNNNGITGITTGSGITGTELGFPCWSWAPPGCGIQSTRRARRRIEDINMHIELNQEKPRGRADSAVKLQQDGGRRGNVIGLAQEPKEIQIGKRIEEKSACLRPGRERVEGSYN
jgi:hypothetical protein